MVTEKTLRRKLQKKAKRKGWRRCKRCFRHYGFYSQRSCPDSSKFQRYRNWPCMSCGFVDLAVRDWTGKPG